MTIDEAIEILNREYDRWKVVKEWNYIPALELGIKALKREMLFRSRVPKKDWSLLSGETE